jgi:hypothetical protein
MKPKIVIWGHTFEDGHTHSFIHYGFYKSFLHLGYDVKWLENSKDNSDIDFENTIVISEHQEISHLPIKKNTKYFIHNIKQDIEKVEYDNVHNFLIYHEEYKNWDSVRKIEDFFWYDEETKTPIIVWATDLLPHEIDNMEPVLYDETKPDVNFVGTVQGQNLITFAHICANNGKNFYNLGGYTGCPQNDNSKFYDNIKSIDAVRNSYISFDIRETQHCRNSYISCRILKNISYGMWTGTNSTKISKFLGEHLTIESNLDILYDRIVSDYSKCDERKIRNSMNYIRDNHTYINRINSLLSII